MKQIKVTPVFFILLLALTACKKEKKDDEIIIESENSASYFQEKLNNIELMDSLSKRVIEHGDTKAYFEIQSIYNIAEQRQTSALYYALIMANKYHYNQAYYDVYYILNSPKVDNKTREMANEYLKKYKKEK
ncbi:hypothetical protein D0809_08220 [Flavobacterium circumlabens]|uniref:Lipoprotein n=1 Tax=Flavobacterium circumlabens TaxID=2133765 RepID=A0A4Y7UGY3_9FLAO|nr:hypothetical protein [Flavobacterium circumlabens]TCN59898.1 hypothetical protein EV142_102518 [Flavobacterium circumlabens]TEB45148.1 hypothetical protein D0809_08220 [Flavobacterium circumlabens]